ncbi:hypothetical protein QBC40DRAFT_306839 [Triangularia verruculosa]|uniref:Uncharacterized protein n=1 Tax=Triangularia verruculosa TaxID=2587418 RepID=A0AAN6XM56_9PEZI|nr:hypothetical protein QBC40DRAFT_306839 [Triangularia verruculosa]
MKLRHKQSPLLLLLLQSLATTAVLAERQLGKDSVDTYNRADPIIDTPAAVKKYGTKGAPIDGKDGRPHAGPFVELDSTSESSELPVLKDRPTDPTIMDGKRIPESNDGVMDDKNRSEPKKGTTGLEGGVSEKDKERKLREQTGERVENKPQAPKEAPPLPHADQEKILAADAEGKDKTSDDVSGLEKPADLPEKTHDKSLPLPNSAANIDHLDITKGSKGQSSGSEEDDGEGLIRPFHSFVLSLTMILFSEIGDKTFLVAALMAMKHDRMVVFTAALTALVAMTILSAMLGHAVPALISERLTHFLAAGLFAVFGVRLLREGLAMSPDEGVSAEMQEVEQELAEKEQEARKHGRRRSSVSPYALEMGLGSRKSRSKSRFPTPPRSPSSSPEGRNGSGRNALSGFISGFTNLCSLLLSPAWVQTFVMTFLGEWGDRSQIATIAMAAGQDYWWVTLGAVLGHAVCTGVAVIGGRAIAGKVSLKVVTVGGAIAFLVFAFIYFIEALYS